MVLTMSKCGSKMSREDKEWDLLTQLPGDQMQDVAILGEYPPLEDYVYSIHHDKVLTLPINKFNEESAKRRFDALCVLQQWRPTEPMFYTGRFWCLRVVRKRSDSAKK